LVAKGTALKQQTPKFYPQNVIAEVNFYIYDRPMTNTNVIAGVY